MGGANHGLTAGGVHLGQGCVVGGPWCKAGRPMVGGELGPQHSRACFQSGRRESGRVGDRGSRLGAASVGGRRGRFTESCKLDGAPPDRRDTLLDQRRGHGRVLGWACGAWRVSVEWRCGHVVVGMRACQQARRSVT